MTTTTTTTTTTTATTTTIWLTAANQLTDVLPYFMSYPCMMQASRVQNAFPFDLLKTNTKFIADDS